MCSLTVGWLTPSFSAMSSPHTPSWTRSPSTWGRKCRVGSLSQRRICSAARCPAPAARPRGPNRARPPRRVACAWACSRLPVRHRHLDLHRRDRAAARGPRPWSGRERSPEVPAHRRRSSPEGLHAGEEHADREHVIHRRAHRLQQARMFSSVRSVWAATSAWISRPWPDPAPPARSVEDARTAHRGGQWESRRPLLVNRLSHRCSSYLSEVDRGGVFPPLTTTPTRSPSRVRTLPRGARRRGAAPPGSATTRSRSQSRAGPPGSRRRSPAPPRPPCPGGWEVALADAARSEAVHGDASHRSVHRAAGLERTAQGRRQLGLDGDQSYLPPVPAGDAERGRLRRRPRAPCPARAPAPPARGPGCPDRGWSPPGRRREWASPRRVRVHSSLAARASEYESPPTTRSAPYPRMRSIFAGEQTGG
jgi:hypothetical protein